MQKQLESVFTFCFKMRSLKYKISKIDGCCNKSFQTWKSYQLWFQITKLWSKTYKFHTRICLQSLMEVSFTLKQTLCLSYNSIRPRRKKPFQLDLLEFKLWLSTSKIWFSTSKIPVKLGLILEVMIKAGTAWNWVLNQACKLVYCLMNMTCSTFLLEKELELIHQRCSMRISPKSTLIHQPN